MIRTRVNKLNLAVLFLCFTACGVKGPPLPPLPTEGSLKKEQTPKKTVSTPEKKTKAQ